MTAAENFVKMEMQGDGIQGIPGGITQAIKIAKYEMLNYIRSRRFYVLLLIDLIIGGLLTVIVGYYRPSSVLASTLSFYSTWWGSIIGFLVVLSCIFFGGDAISGEFQNRTGYFLIGNPIRRSSVYTGKFIGALLSALVVVFLYFFIALANGIYYFGASVPSQLIESLLFSLVYLLSVMGFTFFSAPFSGVRSPQSYSQQSSSCLYSQQCRHSSACLSASSRGFLSATVQA
ncbi:MAG: ABC transporter permease subunit [Thermoplasmata archaeon]|nr:ABC transporter permease subunit [Candidatus Sysuiplasma jiujiangense]